MIDRIVLGVVAILTGLAGGGAEAQTPESPSRWHTHNPETGAACWQHQFGATIHGIGSADSTVFVGTLDGMVYAVVPKPE